MAAVLLFVVVVLVVVAMVGEWLEWSGRGEVAGRWRRGGGEEVVDFLDSVV